MKPLMLCLLLSIYPSLATQNTVMSKTTKQTASQSVSKQPAVKTPVPINYWVHFNPKTADTSLAAYGEFFNVNKDKALYLTAVENDDFERVELHSADKNGKDYQPTGDLPFILPPMGGSVKLEYGGNYILLLNPKKPIIDESETTLILHYRVKGSDKELIQNLVFSVTSNGIGCGAIPPSE